MLETGVQGEGPAFFLGVTFLGRHPDLLVKARIQYEPVWLPEAKPCPW